MDKSITVCLVALIACGSGCTQIDGPEAPYQPEAGQPTAESKDAGDSGTSALDTGTRTDTADAGAIPEEPVNLLRNPGFEDGEAHWGVWGGAEVVESGTYEGARALRMTRLNGAEQLVEGLEPNTIYRLSGSARTDNPDHPINIGVKYHGNPEARAVFTEDTYVERSLEFSTGFGTTSAIIYAYKHSGESLAHADDLSLFRVGTAYDAPIWADEFEGTGSPDPSRWDFEEGFVRNQELQWYQTENVFQESGNLIFEGREERRPNPNYVPGSTDWKTSREYIEYTSASIRTKDRFDWMYGRVVVRAKVTNLTGTWPAIWTLGVDCPWPSNGEVDIMENYGGNLLANFAWGTDRRWSPRWDTSRTPVSSFDPDWTERFHIWELDWTENRMAIYLDGQLLNERSLGDTINGSAECAGQNPFRQHHFLLLNLALGSNGGSVQNLDFPTRYLVDYVRVYQ